MLGGVVTIKSAKDGKMTHSRCLATACLALAMALISRPALAQVDLVGNWESWMHEDWADRGLGPESADLTGLPINEEGRARTLAYSTSMLSVPEHQCLYYQPHYVVIGPQSIRIWQDTHPTTGDVVAWKISAAVDRSIITIWMDGRPHPGADALHTFPGFTTGAWEGNTLVAHTTHMKEGYIRRNGTPSSDQTVTTMFITRHGDTLTVTVFIQDPIYLTEPHVISRNWRLTAARNLVGPVMNGCAPAAELPGLQGDSDVPHYLPGKNPWVNDVTKRYNTPLEAVMGGAETIYPEYRKKLKDKYVAPLQCTRYCCGTGGFGSPNIDTFLGCITAENAAASVRMRGQSGPNPP